MKIVIMGAGVAGVCAAIALAQRGHQIAIYERHPALSTMGAGIILWPNAVHICERLGVLEQMQAISGFPRQMKRMNSQGDDLGALDIEKIDRQMGYTSLSVLRREFHQVLVDKLQSLGVTIQYGYDVVNVERVKAGQVNIIFSDHTRVSGDLVLGCDGRMRSIARAYVSGSNAPKYQGFINWVGVCEVDSPLFDANAVLDFWGVGKRFGIVPISDRKAYWAGGRVFDYTHSEENTSPRAELLANFSDWPDVVTSVIHRSAQRTLHKIFVHDHDPLPVWHKDNLIVLGDAAHAPLPTSGQGACQAMEDAWCLANQLDTHPGQLDVALAAFTQQRFDKTTRIIHAARHFAQSVFNNDKAYCLQRDQRSKLTDYASMASSMADLWSENLLPAH